VTEDEKYVNSMYEMFRTDGWKQLLDDLQKNIVNINSVEATKDNEDMWFRKGQLNILTFITSLEAQVENMDANNEKDL
tara:strand:- start:292 stop:525 length:234 start_codon:yes stop_codon:yes gene_type:complete